MAVNPWQQIVDWYTLSERRKNTFSKLFENNMLTLSQVHRLKQARAAFEVLPLLVWTPYLLFMLPRCLYANTRERVLRVFIFGITGVAGCEVSARALRDAYYWPVVAEVYRDLVKTE